MARSPLVKPLIGLLRRRLCLHRQTVFASVSSPFSPVNNVCLFSPRHTLCLVLTAVSWSFPDLGFSQRFIWLLSPIDSHSFPPYVSFPSSSEAISSLSSSFIIKGDWIACQKGDRWLIDWCWLVSFRIVCLMGNMDSMKTVRVGQFFSIKTRKVHPAASFRGKHVCRHLDACSLVIRQPDMWLTRHVVDYVDLLPLRFSSIGLKAQRILCSWPIIEAFCFVFIVLDFPIDRKKLIPQQHITSNITSNMNLRFMCVSKNMHLVNENHWLTISLEAGWAQAENLVFWYTWYSAWFVWVVKFWICSWFVENEYLQFQVFSKNDGFASYLSCLLHVTCKLLACYL